MSVLNALDVLKDNGLSDGDICNIADTLLENGDLESDSDRKRLAVLIHTGGESPYSIDVSAYDECTISAACGDYLVLTDDEREERLNDALESYLDSGGVEGADSPYFDRQMWKDDNGIDAESWLSSYDGNEYEVHEFFIYRVN